MPIPDAKKICLLRPSAIGDAVHALGLVNGLRRGYPDAHITWILQPVTYEMVMHQSSVDRFITFERNGGIRDWMALFRLLGKERFDLAVIPQASGKTSLITAMLRARVKLGFDYARSRDFHWLATNRHIPPRPMGHVQDQFFEFLDDLGIDKDPPVWNFQFTQQELDWKESFFNKAGSCVVGFVIASAHPEKDWPPERYAAVMDHATRAHGITPMIIGGPSAREKKIADAIRDMCSCRPIIALEKPIRRTMLQLAGCRLVVSPDTGPLHIAVALGTPVVGLYGYSDPRRCGPYMKFGDLLIDRYNEPGSGKAPVSRKTKPGRMGAITVEAVNEKIALGLRRYTDGTRAVYPV